MKPRYHTAAFVAAMLLIALCLAGCHCDRAAAQTTMPGMTMPAGGGTAVSSANLPPVIVTGYIPDVDSLKVEWQAYPGARDYRIVDLANLSTTKYAGLDYSKPGNPPCLSVEINNITPGTPHTFVIQAVDAVGPVSKYTLYTPQNSPLYPAPEGEMPPILGADEGMTPLDGLNSTNGQGAWTNLPRVIAQSAPFTASSTGVPQLPSASDATQVFFDTFTSATITPTSLPDLAAGNVSYGMKTAAGNQWDVLFRNADTSNSRVFVMAQHPMIVLFDGGTPNSNDPLHQGHGAAAMSPQQTIDFTGAIAHFMFECDAHVYGRRWIALNLSPDPITNFDFNTGPINTNNQGFFVQVQADNIQTDIYTKDAGKPVNYSVAGALGQADHWGFRSQDGVWNHLHNGNGLDNRSRFDVFLDQNRVQVYEDGVLQQDYPLAYAGDLNNPKLAPHGGLPFTKAHVYFTQYVYHSDLMLQELRQLKQSGASDEEYWLNDVPYSDERHWDNMGFEVLPTTDWSTTAKHIVMQSLHPVAAPVPTPVPTPTPIPAAPSSSTVTLTPAGGSPVSVTVTVSPSK